MHRALLETELKDYRAAIADLDTAIKLIPASEELYLYRGLAKQYINEHLAAIADFTEVIKWDAPLGDIGVVETDISDPMHPKQVVKKETITTTLSYKDRAASKYQLKDYNGALADYKKALSYDPKFAEVYYQRAMMRVEMKQFAEACADFCKAKELGYKDSDEMIKKYCK